jgi:hypothetical protein
MAVTVPSNVITNPIDVRGKESMNISLGSASSSRHASSASDFSEDQNAYGTSLSSVGSDISHPASQDTKKVDGYTTYYPHPTSFQLREHAIDEYTPLKVRLEHVLIGADAHSRTRLQSWEQA